jgi:glucokinase
VSAPPEPVLAIDIGGTKLAAGLVDGGGLLRNRREVPTAPTEAAAGEALWATLTALIEDVCDGELPRGIGVGCGGPMRWPQGLVSPLNLPAWRDFPLRVRLREMFAGAVVRVANDAVAMAVGDHWRGVGVGVQNFLGVVVSTGVGGGLIIDGKVVHGATGNAGHIGHSLVVVDGPPCACGARGCLEAVARGPATVQWALNNGWSPSGGSGPDGRSLLAAARSGDDVAVAAFARAGDALGTAIASATVLLELDMVAVGGGISNAGDLLLGPARAAFARHARLDFAGRCKIVRSALDHDAGLIGAAAFVLAGEQYWTNGAD